MIEIGGVSDEPGVAQEGRRGDRMREWTAWRSPRERFGAKRGMSHLFQPMIPSHHQVTETSSKVRMAIPAPHIGHRGFSSGVSGMGGRLLLSLAPGRLHYRDRERCPLAVFS